MNKSQLIGAFCAVIFIYSNAAMAVSFTPIGSRIEGDSFRSVANSVSGDGSVVVGWDINDEHEFDGQAFRWTSAGGMVSLGTLPPDYDGSNALDVSADGLVIVGDISYGHGNVFEAFRWTSDGGIVSLGSLPGDYFSAAYGASGDGSVVVGTSHSDSGRQAFRWTSEGGMVGLGDLPGGDFLSHAFGVSADGSVVIGWGTNNANDREAFRWTSEGSMMGLGDLPGGDINSWASDVSANGLVVVGQGESTSGREAFRWTNESGMVGLGDLDGGDFYSVARGVSANGSVVVGDSTSASGTEAFRWTSEDGMRSVASILTAAGVDLTGWTLSIAYGVSADGYTIVGSGTNPDGNTEAWIATLNTFFDVPPGYWAIPHIETLVRNGITNGCGPNIYCPENPVTRDQMAVFLERGMRGGDFQPELGAGNVFLDVPASYWAGGWIELLYMDGITTGCGNFNYCPEHSTTRAETAVFLLRAKHGQDYAPPTPTGIFNDVDLNHWAAPWIEQLANEGITSGCGNANYCPNDPVTRAQMAVFLVRTFDLYVYLK